MWSLYNPNTNILTDGNRVGPDWDADADWKGCLWYNWTDDLTFHSPHQPGKVGYRLPYITTREHGIIKLNKVLVLLKHDEEDYED